MDAARVRPTGALWRKKTGVAVSLSLLVSLGPVGISQASESLVVAPVVEQSQMSPTEWCDVLRPARRQDPRNADLLMSGTVNLNKYGTYQLAEEPDWLPQRTTDTAGNRDLASLVWLLPLIREGLRRGDEAMVGRARVLLWSWLTANPSSRPPSPADWPLIAGKRAVALHCAAALMEDPVLAVFADSEVRRMESVRTGWGGVNNTHLAGYTGLLFHACANNLLPMRARAVQKLQRTTLALINRDGSDIEGSPAYARYTLDLLADAERVKRACGESTEEFGAAVLRMERFLAHAVRPDFLMETIGDSTAEAINPVGLRSDSPLLWAATNGASGTPPVPTYAAFTDGGYIFGRSAWSRSGQDTFYSLRAVPAGRRTSHSHDDSTAMTLFSQSVNWIGDPGPYRYSSEALRQSIIKRHSHSGLTVVGKRVGLKGKMLLARTTGSQDMSCVRDQTWQFITLIRCIQYSRDADVFLVQDRIIDRRAKKSAPISVVQRWQIPSGVTASIDESNPIMEIEEMKSLTLRSGERSMQILADRDAQFSIESAFVGGLVGWFTGAYGTVQPGSVLSRRVQVRGSTEMTLTTVFARGGEGFSTSLMPIDPSAPLVRVVRTRPDLGEQTITFAPQARRFN
jgi:hypothetical protein